MEYELVSQKIGPDKHLVKNKVTNEPVAFLTRPKHSYSRKEVELSWHPNFKLLHPEVDENLLTRNFPNKLESVSNATDHLTYKSRPYVFGREVPKDPLKSKYMGETPVPDAQSRKLHTWHLFDDEGTRVGTFKSQHGPSTIHEKSEVNATLAKEYVDKNPIPDSVKEAAVKKHPGRNLSDTLHRIRYMIDNRSKEPRFIGTLSSKESNSHLYKTKLAPEEASKAYEEHLRGKLTEKGTTFQRHSPTVFSAHKPADGEYGSAVTHHVISVPGELHHIISRFDHPDYSMQKRNTQIVESVGQKKYRPLSLEDHISLYNFIADGK